MKIMKNKFLLTLAGVVMATAVTVQAVPINGTIDIGAFISHAEIDFTANTVDFVDDEVIPLPGNALVVNATGDFVPFLLQVAEYEDFTYNPLAVTNPLWELVSGLVSFDLTAITFINEMPGVGLTLTGVGVVKAAGFDDTPGTWSFSADTANSTANFTFSSQTSTVPDGGATVMLLGGVLTAFGFIRRQLAA